jgi:hypothetical protein
MEQDVPTRRIETGEFTLVGDAIQQTITLTGGGSSSTLLLKSISHIINDTQIRNSHSATCLSRSVISLLDICPLDYNLSLKLVMCLTQQLDYLVKHGHSFYLFEPANVVMFDETRFVYISSRHLTQIHETKLKIWYPFTRSFFLSPEMKEIVCLPAQVNVSTTYYSLGMLVIFSLFSKQIACIGEGSICYETLVDMLEPIHSTKLYWFLLRSINQETQERVLLFC